MSRSSIGESRSSTNVTTSSTSMSTSKNMGTGDDKSDPAYQPTTPHFTDNLAEDATLSGGAMNGFIQGRDVDRDHFFRPEGQSLNELIDYSDAHGYR